MDQSSRAGRATSIMDAFGDPGDTYQPLPLLIGETFAEGLSGCCALIAVEPDGCESIVQRGSQPYIFAGDNGFIRDTFAKVVSEARELFPNHKFLLRSFSDVNRDVPL
jgi:hypothetical protein